MQKKLKQAQKSFKNLGKDLNNIGEGLTKKLTVPIVAATSALAMMGLRAAKAAADMDDLAMVTNIGVEDLQAYAYAGEMLGRGQLTPAEAGACSTPKLRGASGWLAAAHARRV
jgi:hypothetical protein